MLTREDNELITQVGPGTPMGELFRRFWLPVMLAEEVPNADSTPEHLLRSDEGIIRVRQRLIRTARKLMEGEEPAEPSKPEAYKARTVRKFYASDFPINEAVKELKGAPG